MIVLWVLFAIFLVSAVSFSVLWATGEPSAAEVCECLPIMSSEGRLSFYDTPITGEPNFSYTFLPDFKIEYTPSVSGSPVEVDDRVSEHYITTLLDPVKKVLRVKGLFERLGMENPSNEENTFESAAEFTIEMYLAVSTAKTPDLRTRVTPIREMRIVERSPEVLSHFLRNHPWSNVIENDEMVVDGRLWPQEEDFDTELKVYRMLRIKSTSKVRGAKFYTPTGFTGTIQLGERFEV